MIKIRRKFIDETKQIALLIVSETECTKLCPTCREQVRMVSPLLAAKLFNLSTREIYWKIDAGKLHFEELQDRQMFICLPSLQDYLKSMSPQKSFGDNELRIT